MGTTLPDTPAIRARQQWLDEYTGNQRRQFDAVASEEWDSKPIATSRLMIELDRVMEPNAEVVSELITSDAYPRRYLKFDHTKPASERRKQYYTTSGVLGWGVAAAISIVIFNNGQYQANRMNQKLYKRRIYETGKYIGVNLRHPNNDRVKIVAKKRRNGFAALALQALCNANRENRGHPMSPES